MSIFKDFPTVKQQYLEVRSDIFNLFNHPSWGQPGNTNDSTNAGLITSCLGLQNNTPDARFFQLSAKYVF
ncbi:MAG: outer membrane beta-barrel protein [Acidobacteriaceae bacterium]